METPNQFRRSKLQFKLARFFASQALVSFLKALAKLLRVSNLKSAISTLVRMITGSIGQMIRESKRIGQTTTDQVNKIPWGHVFAYALVVTIMALTAFNVYLFREQMPWSTMGAILLRVASIAPFVAASILLALAIYLIIKYSVLATKFVLTKSVTYLWRLVKMLVSVLVRVFHFEFNKRNADEGWEVSILSISVLSKTKNSISILSISLGTLSYLAIGLAGASILTISLFSTGDGAQDPFPKDSLPESESIDEVIPPLLPAEIDEALGSDATPIDPIPIQPPEETENARSSRSSSSIRSVSGSTAYWRTDSALEIINLNGDSQSTEELILFGGNPCVSGNLIAVGMTSAAGSWLLNQQLARKRAQSVTRLLAQKVANCASKPAIISAAFVHNEPTVPASAARSLFVVQINSTSPSRTELSEANRTGWTLQFGKPLNLSVEDIHFCSMSSRETLKFPKCNTVW